MAIRDLSSLVEAGDRRRITGFIKKAEARMGCGGVFITQLRDKVNVRFSVSPLADSAKILRGYAAVALRFLDGTHRMRPA